MKPIVTELVGEVKHWPWENVLYFGADPLNIRRNHVFLTLDLLEVLRSPSASKRIISSFRYKISRNR